MKAITNRLRMVWKDLITANMQALCWEDRAKTMCLLSRSSSYFEFKDGEKGKYGHQA